MPEITIDMKDYLENYFNDNPNKSYKYSEIKQITFEFEENFKIKYSTGKLIDYLEKQNKLKKISFDFPRRKEVRYIWGQIPFYELLLSIFPDSYFSHDSALFFNKLITQKPQTFYVNVEQSDKTFINNELEQGRIDSAFQNKPRKSNNLTKYSGYKICILNGKYTDNLGVYEKILKNNAKIQVTDIERTLIDITVRPFYSGGIYNVFRAYKKAKNDVSIEKLINYLEKIEYIYPYHQAIGFILSKTGVYENEKI